MAASLQLLDLGTNSPHFVSISLLGDGYSTKSFMEFRLYKARIQYKSFNQFISSENKNVCINLCRKLILCHLYHRCSLSQRQTVVNEHSNQSTKKRIVIEAREMRRTEYFFGKFDLYKRFDFIIKIISNNNITKP